jgi:hypothetical protein
LGRDGIVREPKTKPTTASVAEFVATIPDERKRDDSRVIIAMMQDVTGQPPVLWGDSIIGFGTTHYRYASGRTGDWPPIGFSPRNASISLYFLCDQSVLEDQLTRFGKHSRGKSCIYIKRLSDVDIAVLREMIAVVHQLTSSEAN